MTITRHPESPVFVCALWDSSGPNNRDRALKKLGESLSISQKRRVRGGGKTSGMAMAKSLNAICYAYDDESSGMFSDYGIQSIRLHDDDEYWNTENGQWCRKFNAMRHAVSSYGSALWLDLDCALLRKVPTDFWSSFNGGGDIKAPLLRHIRRKSLWREGLSKKYHSGGYYWYCRRPEIIDRMIDLMMDNRTWIDEHAIGYVIDELEGGWAGPEEYQKRGYEAPWIRSRGCDHLSNPVFAH